MHYIEAPVYNAISYATLKLRSDLVWPDSLSSYFNRISLPETKWQEAQEIMKT